MPTREEQYKKLRAKLEEDLRSSRSAIGEIDDESAELAQDSDQEGGVPANHMADDGSNVYERERLLTIEQEMRDRVTAINDALQRMDDGTYGTCARCGKSIPIARLDIMPFAEYCVECQEVIDAEDPQSGQKQEQPLQP